MVYISIEKYEFLDTWILFPVFVIQRMMQRKIVEKSSFKNKLDLVYGSGDWESEIYSSRQDLFGKIKVREKGPKNLLELYKNQLADLFGNRFLESTRSLYNTKNAHLYEFIFCTGRNTERSIKLSQKIASYLLNDH